MDFTLTCDCGKQTKITEAAADRVIECECGRTKTVPSYRELRQMAGQPADNVSPVLVIQQLRDKGELWPQPECVWCGDKSDEVMHFIVSCERAWVQRPDLIGRGSSLISMFRRQSWKYQEESTTRGSDLVFDIPVTVCSKCREKHLKRGSSIVGAVKWVLLLAGAVLMPFEWVIGVPLAAGFVVVLFLEESPVTKEIRRCGAALRRVKLYSELLDRYPEAHIALRARSSEPSGKE